MLGLLITNLTGKDASNKKLRNYIVLGENNKRNILLAILA